MHSPSPFSRSLRGHALAALAVLIVAVGFALKSPRDSLGQPPAWPSFSIGEWQDCIAAETSCPLCIGEIGHGCQSPVPYGWIGGSCIGPAPVAWCNSSTFDCGARQSCEFKVPTGEQCGTIVICFS